MRWFVLMLGVMSSPVVWGHGVHAAEPGFMSGLLHPMTGIDHVLAAVGMGWWLGLQRFTRLSIPLYCVALTAGIVPALWSGAGNDFAGIEWMLAVTLIFTGLFLYKPLRLPQLPAAAVIGAVFCCHFYAHITEMPPAMSGHGALYTLGFFIATVSMIAASALSCTAVSGRAVAVSMTRFAGAAIAAAGVTVLGLA